jgi:biopolymer transport protein ExbD
MKMTTIKEITPMLKRFIFCLLTIVLFTGLLHAHGDPIMGTVTAVTNDTFTVKDKDNKSIVIMLEKGTKYLINDKPTKKSDLKVGARVVIDAHMDTKMKMYSAEEVKIGAAKE